MGKFNKSEEWLFEEYVIKNRSRKEIAQECGLSEAGVKSLLIKLDIKKEKFTIDKNRLEELYNTNLTTKEIGEILNCHRSTVEKYIKVYNLSQRKPINNKYNDASDNDICELYLEGFSSTEIADLFGVTHRTVLNHLHHNNIKVRSLSESQWNFNKKDFPEGLKDYDIVYDLYITQRISKSDLGVKFGCAPHVIDRILKEFNIPVRGCGEAQTGLTGDKSHNWKGGITPLTARLREFSMKNISPKIRERDNYECKLCGSHSNLHVHHIKPFSNIVNEIISNNPDLTEEELYNLIISNNDFLSEDNLITYCKDCHFYKIHKFNQRGI